MVKKDGVGVERNLIRLLESMKPNNYSIKKSVIKTIIW